MKQGKVKRDGDCCPVMRYRVVYVWGVRGVRGGLGLLVDNAGEGKE